MQQENVDFFYQIEKQAEKLLSKPDFVGNIPPKLVSEVVLGQKADCDLEPNSQKQDLFWVGFRTGYQRQQTVKLLKKNVLVFFNYVLCKKLIVVDDRKISNKVVHFGQKGVNAVFFFEVQNQLVYYLVEELFFELQNLVAEFSK